MLASSQCWGEYALKQSMFEKSAEFVIPRYSEGSRDGENRFESRDPSEYLGMTGLNVGTFQTPSQDDELGCNHRFRKGLPQ
jgi:hypothetical protein